MFFRQNLPFFDKWAFFLENYPFSIISETNRFFFDNLKIFWKNFKTFFLETEKSLQIRRKV